LGHKKTSGSEVMR